MVNPFKDTNWNPGTQERRAFGRSLLIGFPLIAAAMAGYFWFRTGEVGSLPWLLGIGGAAAGLLFWILPAVAKPFYVIWFFAACCVGIVVTNLVIALFYYLVITPIGWSLRLSGRDALNRRAPSGTTTYWQDVPVADQTGERYFRQF